MANRSSIQTGIWSLAARAAVSTSFVTLALATTLMLLADIMALQRGFVARSLVLYLSAVMAFALLLPMHLPHRVFGLANHVTLVRLAMVSVLAGLVGQSGAPAAWLVVAIASLVVMLDGVDGWVARRTGLCSAFGARFDMETDALLILLLSVLVWQFDKAGAWILLAGMARYLFVAAAVFFKPLGQALRDSWRRKFVCVLQIVSLLVAMLPVIATPQSAIVALVGLLALSYSFLVDIRWLMQR